MGKELNYVTGPEFEKQIVGELPITMKGVEKARKIITEYTNTPYTQFKRIGQNTKNENGDIKVNNKIWEIKHLTSNISSSGTYLNTSISTMDRYVDKTFKDFVKESGSYEYWESQFGNKYPVRERLSPISNYLEADEFRKTKKEQYKVIRKLDRLTRKQYVEYCYNYFIENPESLIKFVADILSKNISDKQPPDYILVYNEITDTIKVIDKKSILDRDTSNFRMSPSKLALIFDKFRINFGWQNGNGLCNPTLRVFLK